MNIGNIFNRRNYFLKHLNNFELDETKPHGMFGTSNARIFKDKSTDSFVEYIFTTNEKLYTFIDYCFYVIFADIINIHERLREHNYFLNNKEFITLIFKGGNVMSFFYDEIIKQKVLSVDKVKFKLSSLKEYLLCHEFENINGLFDNNDGNIESYLIQQRSKFKISDVDFTIYINIVNEIKYSIVSEIYGKILMYSLIIITNFFNSYYDHVVNNDNPEIKALLADNDLDFISNDNPLNPNIHRINCRINKIKKENQDNDNKDEDDQICNNSIIVDFSNEIQYILHITVNTFNRGNFVDETNIFFDDIRNIRLFICINEYLKLFRKRN